MTDRQFPKRARILRGRDFDRVFANRVSAADGLVIVYGAANELGHPRLGLAVSRRHGSAVERNRWKRLLREAFRLSQRELPPLDLVFVPRPGVTPNFSRLLVALPQLARQVQDKMNRGRRRPPPSESRNV